MRRQKEFYVVGLHQTNGQEQIFSGIFYTNLTQQNDYNGEQKCSPKGDYMKIFKPMSLEEAKEFYEILKAENKARPNTLLRIAMNDIWFFTDELTKNY